jgi:hypothetical protein
LTCCGVAHKYNTTAFSRACPAPPLRPDEPFQLPHLPFQDGPIKEQQRAQRLAVFSREDRSAGGETPPELGEHFLLGQFHRPGRPELEVRLIDDGRPVPAPIEPKVCAQRANCLVLDRFRKVFLPLEDPDVEGDSKIVVRVSAAGVGDFQAGLCAPLGIELILLRVGSQATDDLDANAIECSLLNQGSRHGLNLGQQSGDVLLAPNAAIISSIFRGILWLLSVRCQPSDGIT